MASQTKKVSGASKAETIARQVVSALVMFPAIGVFVFHGMLVKCFVRNKLKRQHRLIQNVSRYSRFALRIIRVRINVRSGPNLMGNYLIVSNHLSYLDMMVIASVFPAAFVTSIDMGEVFFLGTMAELGGSVFIERRHRERIGFDIKQLSGHLQSGFHVVLFPEGTSTCGDEVLPFKRSLLLAAQESGKQILPITLRYTSIDGEPFSIQNRDSVCWYGEMGFLPHFLRLLGLRSVNACLDIHAPILPRAADTKDTLAKWTHRVVSSAYFFENHAIDQKKNPRNSNHMDADLILPMLTE